MGFHKFAARRRSRALEAASFEKYSTLPHQATALENGARLGCGLENAIGDQIGS
jgi:hypothetical protein